jgi:hypothetical protein
MKGTSGKSRIHHGGGGGHQQDNRLAEKEPMLHQSPHVIRKSDDDKSFVVQVTAIHVSVHQM